MMRILNHGGRCCGVKHILGFPYRPIDKVAALPKRQVYHGAGTEMDNPAKDFFPGPEPMETALERLNKLVKYLDGEKSSHLAEVILDAGVVTNWRTTLEDLGFKEVSVFVNSNTHCKLWVFHRITPLPKKPTTKKEGE